MADVSLPPRTQTEPVEIGNGVACHWMADGKVLVFKLSSSARITIDSWIAGMEEAITHWSPDEPAMLLHDVATLPLTPYMRQQSEALIKRHADKLWGRVAVVLRPGVFTNVIRFFAEREASKLNPRMTRRIFTSREAAIEWLAEPIKKP